RSPHDAHRARMRHGPGPEAGRRAQGRQPPGRGRGRCRGRLRPTVGTEHDVRSRAAGARTVLKGIARYIMTSHVGRAGQSPMLAPAPAHPVVETLADLVRRVGSVPLERIPARPAPGTATEADVLARAGGVKRLYELVDGVLVGKAMGYYESLLAGFLIQIPNPFLTQDDLGIVLGADGPLRLAPGVVRIPDVSFISWSHFPDRELPAEPIPDLAPDLAVEVLSEGNTPQEMALKLRE